MSSSTCQKDRFDKFTKWGSWFKLQTQCFLFKGKILGTGFFLVFFLLWGGSGMGVGVVLRLGEMHRMLIHWEFEEPKAQKDICHKDICHVASWKKRRPSRVPLILFDTGPVPKLSQQQYVHLRVWVWFGLFVCVCVFVCFKGIKKMEDVKSTSILQTSLEVWSLENSHSSRLPCVLLEIVEQNLLTVQMLSLTARWSLWICLFVCVDMDSGLSSGLVWCHHRFVSPFV